MFREILSFEVRYRLKKISTYIYFGFFFFLGFFIICRTSSGGGPLRKLIGAGMGNIHANAPFVLYYLITLLTHFGILITAAYFGKAAHRDFKENTYGLYFSYPLKKTHYLAGRFGGAFITTLFVFSGVGIGAFLGSISPWVNPEKIGPIDPWVYIQPYCTGVLPNILAAGALFFTLALLTRKFFPVYTGIAAVLVSHLLGKSIASNYQFLPAALIDPLGDIAARGIYAYWSAAQKNTLFIPLSGHFLYNRLVWITLGITILVIAVRKFRFTHISEPGHRIAGKFNGAAGQTIPGIQSPKVTQVFDFKNHVRQMLFTMYLEFKGLVKRPSFLIILLLGTVFIFVVGFKNVGLVRGTQSYPVTIQVLETTRFTLYLFCLAIVLFGSAELIRRERNQRVQDIYDALPVPEWVPFLGKLGALVLVQVLLMLTVMSSGIIIQLIHGYYRFELGLYIKELLGIRLIYYILISILAMCIQTVVNKKFPGYVIGLLLIDDFFPSIGLTHHLWNFASIPDYTYSDISGYGPFARAILFFNLYWGSLAVLLVVITLLMWVRGKETHFKERLRNIRPRLTKSKLTAIGLSIVLCLIFGGYIIYNTTILNRCESDSAIEKRQAEYEKTFKMYENHPQPRVTGVKLEVDMFPGQRRVHACGQLVLKNRTGTVIREIVVQMPPKGRVKRLKLAKTGFLKEYNQVHGVYIYLLADPLQPGEVFGLNFDLEIEEKGFKNNNENTSLVRNGSFLYYYDVIPGIGYDPHFRGELTDNDRRTKYGLAGRERIPLITDEKARMNIPISRDGDWIDFEALVSTGGNQTVITCGELVSQWQQGQRRYFQYKNHGKMLKYFAFLSAVYTIKKERWQDVDIEIYFHEGHDYNIDLMIDAVKKSLAYFTRNFSPYPFKYLRVVEFPRYELYGEAFPGVIPLSEGYGFIARFDQAKLPYVFRVMAHEVGHQWWAHQVIGANVQGMFVLSEVMAQYSALMVVKQDYDQDKINEFIKKCMDSYWRGRSRETEKEVPLVLTNIETPYLHYEKGMVVMNALQDYIGEDRINETLRKYIHKAAFQEPPFTTSLEWLQYLKSVTPDHLKYLFTDMLETITLYENKALKASYDRLPGGKYRVKLAFAANKYRADDQGNEVKIDFNDYIAFGVFSGAGEVLYLGKHRVSGNGEIEFVVDKVPARAGIDPYYFLVDKNLDDNLIDFDGPAG